MKTFIQILLLAALLSSCNNDYFFEDYTDLGDQGWSLSEVQTFEFETSDTASVLNFYLDLRNTEAYPYQNIYAFIEMTFPNGQTLRDTIEYPYLADDAGRWTGGGMGSSYDNSILYKQGGKLPLPGEYLIKVQHGMRDSILLGIERVGIHIDSRSD